jgi:hypothetical protein
METETKSHPDHGVGLFMIPPGLEVIEGVRPLGLAAGDVVMRVDTRADGSLCCLTVLRRSQ